METQIVIPVLKKNRIANENLDVAATASCCTPKSHSPSACCTPSQKPEDNGGACCPQPADGSACCDK